MKDEKRERTPKERLNEFQARRLRVTFAYIDRLLCEIEGMLHASSSHAAFPRYAADVSARQCEKIDEFIARLRTQLVRALESQGMERERAPIPALRAIQAAIGSIDMAVEELKPRHMRGYGEVPEAVAAELNGIVKNLGGLVAEFDRYVRGRDEEGVRQATKGDSD